jgi:hypothetical protein
MNINEITAMEHLNDFNRMCMKCQDNYCEGCGLENTKLNTTCFDFRKKHPETVIQIVHDWAKANPTKTRQSEFLKGFPNAALNDDGIISIVPCDIDKAQKDIDICSSRSCGDCQKEYWGEEIK